MNSRSIFLHLVAAGALCLVLTLNSPSAAPSPEAALSSLVFKNGGIGKEDRRMNPPGYRARLVFANAEGQFFAGVDVVFIRGGKKRRVRSEGPWLWVKGAPGLYQVEARSSGASARKKINLPAEGMAIFVFRLK